MKYYKQFLAALFFVDVLFVYQITTALLQENKTILPESVLSFVFVMGIGAINSLAIYSYVENKISAWKDPKVGELWAYSGGSPWPQPNGNVYKIIDVKDGWVKFIQIDANDKCPYEDQAKINNFTDYHIKVQNGA